jgi:hypothetical protein
MCPMCNKEEGWSHTLRCDETRSWRDELVDKRFRSIDPETGIGRRVTSKNKTGKCFLHRNTQSFLMRFLQMFTSKCPFYSEIDLSKMSNKKTRPIC